MCFIMQENEKSRKIRERNDERTMSLASLHVAAINECVSVYMRDNKHKLIKCRALLGLHGRYWNAMFCFWVDRETFKHTCRYTFFISTINGMSTERHNSNYDIVFFCKCLTYLTIPTIADLVPSEVFSCDSVKLRSNIKLADPKFHLSRSINLFNWLGSNIVVIHDWSN